MEDKLTNMIIAVIFIIVIILAVIFGIRIFNSKNEVAVKPSYVTNIEETNAEKTDGNSNITDKTDVIEKQNKNEPISNTKIDNNANINKINTNNNTNTNTNTQITNTQIQTYTANVEEYKYNNRYYYNQLNNYEKGIYDAIVKNVDKLKTGNSIIKIDYDFSKLMNEKDGNEKIKTYYGDAVNALNLDVPNLFYIDLSRFCLRIESTTTILGTKYELFIDSGINNNYFLDGFETEVQVEQAIKSIEAIKNHVIGNTKGEEYIKVKLVHDWIIDYLSYNSSAKYKTTVYGALLEKQAVCEGYARTYKYLLDSIGVENILVVGNATNSSGTTEEHMWNYVKINNKWYAVDATWDDPIVHGGGTIGYDIKHKYFLIGSDEISKSHVIKNKISPDGQEFTLPVLSKSKY